MNEPVQSYILVAMNLMASLSHATPTSSLCYTLVKFIYWLHSSHFPPFVALLMLQIHQKSLAIPVLQVQVLLVAKSNSNTGYLCYRKVTPPTSDVASSSLHAADSSVYAVSPSTVLLEKKCPFSLIFLSFLVLYIV